MHAREADPADPSISAAVEGAPGGYCAPCYYGGPRARAGYLPAPRVAPTRPDVPSSGDQFASPTSFYPLTRR